MKRLICFLLIALCISGLMIPASARSSAEQMNSEAKVGADGGCDVTISATVIFDETVANPEFPVPEEAENVKLNGNAVDAKSADHARRVDLSAVTGGAAGTYSITITYRLDAAVKAQGNGKMLLTLPILVGFAYPVDALTVTVTLPGNVESEPEFISGYYQQHTDKLLETTVSGATVTIVSQQMLLDHETLSMTLLLDESLFPKPAVKARVLGLLDIAILISVLLALVYYVLTMRPTIPKKPLRTAAPDGVLAGEVPMWLTGRKSELTMMVVSWAQLGYLRIEVSPDGRIILHKRMEMGNERSAFEMRCYKNLFGRRRILDGTSDHYARMVRLAAKKGTRVKEVYSKKSGNPWIFRLLCALPALLSGINLSAALAQSGYARFGLVVLIAVLALLVQSTAKGFVLRGKLPVWIGFCSAAAWMTLAVCGGQWLTALLLVAFEFLAGVLTVYGGKRTELGQQALVQIMGLRRFMRKAEKPDLQRMMKVNPGYFHELAPYALILGMDRTFARRFAKVRIPECTYLVSARGQMSASEWAAMLRKVVRTLDAKAKSPFGGRR